MSSALDLDGASLIAFALETLCYGIFCLLAPTALYILVSENMRTDATGSRRPVLKVLVTAVITLFLGSTAHWIINFIRAVDAFIYFRDVPGPVPGPILYYADFHNPKYLLKTALLIFNVVVTDACMTYRTWTVWQRNWKIVIVPILLVCTTLMSGIVLTYQFSILPPGTDIFVSECGRWIIIAFTMMLTTNTLCTSLIAYKIVSSGRRLGHARVGGMSLMPIIVVLVESAALYAVDVAITLILYLVGSNAQFMTLDMLTPLSGIVFTAVIVRIGLGIDTRTSGRSRPTMPSNRFIHSNISHQASHFQDRGAIEISVLRETDTDNSANAKYDDGHSGGATKYDGLAV